MRADLRERSRAPGTRTPIGCAAGAAFAWSSVGSAGAAEIEGLSQGILTGPLGLSLAVLAVAVFVWTVVSNRRLLHAEAEARRRLAELEVQLNDSEAILTAEPHLLYIWRAREAAAERIVGDMRGTARVPADAAERADFAAWLVPESAVTLGEALQQLRKLGTPFNFGVKTHAGDLLEADGRTAGGLATLRLRPLAGERRELTDLAHECRKLARQVERLAAILDHAPLPIWLRGMDARIAWANRAYVRSVDEKTLDAVIARDLAIAPPAPGAGAEPASPRRVHTVIAGAKKALDIVEVSAADGTAGFAIDVTALEEAERELDRHGRAHASTLNKLATAIATFGPERRLRYYNAAYAELWPLDAQWLDARPSDAEVLDRLREMRRLPEQANYRDWKARQLDAVPTREAREELWHLPGGQTLRVLAEQHSFGGVTYLYENVTERLQLESRYNELIDVQRETLDNLHEGVALVGSDGRLKLHNPAYASFWRLDDAFLAGEPHIDAVVDACRRLFDGKGIWDELKYAVTAVDDGRRPLQDRIERPDGKVLQFASAPLADGNTLLTYVDVTDSAGIEKALRERAEALEAAGRLKSHFLSNVSYELRTPLTAIIGFADSLALGLAGPLEPKQKEYMQDIQTSSADLLAIIDAILDLTTIDAGAMELVLDEVEVDKLLTEPALAARERIRKRGMTLEIEIPEGAGRVVADEKRMKQVLANLISNAIGFSANGNTIRMGARLDGEHMLFWVSDTGKGIDPEFQQAAFERFQSRPGRSGHRGPGLGLSLVKSFVELHGGSVSLRSKIDRGTTVICRLPVAGPAAGRRRKAS